MILRCKLISLLILFYLGSQAQIQTPNDFLPHNLGEHFTPHHHLQDYFEHVAEQSKNVQVIQYGATNQNRPLIAAFISSEDNLAKLDDIRQAHLARAGYNTDVSATEHELAIVWLSFSVHGNEAAGTESSYDVLYKLADPNNTEAQAWLENTVVILDPCLNPDGYSRYIHWVRNYAGHMTNVDHHDAEHNEPWPGGRTNHYFFDLNRDWAWQTQKESRARIKLYHNWLPHIHADLHEMGAESPYYFAPAAQPYHERITDWQREFQVDIGKNHAKYFDANGWLYYTKEIFDLLYPSYGDTYPMFNGAVGMTYEQGGSSRAGRAYKMKNGEVLTLRDRINHHTTTALSTVEISSLNAEKLISEYKSFYTNRKPGKYQSYVIKNAGNGSIDDLAQLLDRQKIQYSYANAERNASGHSYKSRKNANFKIEDGDLLIGVDQPKAVLVDVLMDPSPKVVDSLTYDITSWALPYAFGVEAYACNFSVDKGSDTNPNASNHTDHKVEDAYGHVLMPGGNNHLKAIAALLSKKVNMRVAQKKFNSGGTAYPKGTWLITKADNASHATHLQTLNAIAESHKVHFAPISSGFSENGPDLGSSSMRLIKQPKAIALMGEGISQYSFGQVRYYFEQVLGYPISVAARKQISGIKWSNYNTLILPDGRYGFSEKEMTTLTEWVKQGGKVISIARAANEFADKKGFQLKKKKMNKKDSIAMAKKPIYSARQRHRISMLAPGAIILAEKDNSHPFLFGFNEYYSLKTHTLSFDKLEKGNNIAWVGKDPMISGFMGSVAQKRVGESLILGSESMGSGSIIYMIDNPLFRGFWYSGNRLFGNALFMHD